MIMTTVTTSSSSTTTNVYSIEAPGPAGSFDNPISLDNKTDINGCDDGDKHDDGKDKDDCEDTAAGDDEDEDDVQHLLLEYATAWNNPSQSLQPPPLPPPASTTASPMIQRHSSNENRHLKFFEEEESRKMGGRSSSQPSTTTTTNNKQTTTATTLSSSSFVVVPLSASSQKSSDDIIVDDDDDDDDEDIAGGDNASASRGLNNINDKKKNDDDDDGVVEGGGEEETQTNKTNDGDGPSMKIAKSLEHSFAAVAAPEDGSTSEGVAVAAAATTSSNPMSDRSGGHGSGRPVTPPPSTTKLAPRLSRSVPPKIPPQRYSEPTSTTTKPVIMTMTPARHSSRTRMSHQQQQQDYYGAEKDVDDDDDDGAKDTQLVSLFGGNVGKYVTDVSASYFRVSGRLYLSTRAIMFYSNIFGFERRLCLALSDVLSIESYRSTSVRITMIDCEDFVFKRIEQRDSTLALLTGTLRQFKASEGGRLPQMTGFVTLVDSDTSHLQQMEDYRQSMFNNDSTETEDVLSSSDYLPYNTDTTPDKMLQYDNIHEESLRPRLSSEHTPDQDNNNSNELLLYPNTQGQIESEFMTIRDSSTSIPSIAEYCPIRRRSLSVPTLHATQTKFDFSQQQQQQPRQQQQQAQANPQTDISKDRPVTTSTGTKVTNSRQQSLGVVTRTSIPRAVSVPFESSKATREVSRFVDFVERFDNAASAPSNRLNGKNLRHSKSLETDSPSKVSSQPRLTPPSQGQELAITAEEKKQDDDYDLLTTTKVRTSWMETKVTHPNVAVAPLALAGCTLDDFFTLFLADGAPNSLARYQKEVVGDTDLQFQKWRVDDKPPVMGATSVRRRSIKYVHPVKGGIGPSTAKTIRQQCLSRFGRIGMLLANTTEVSGIPMADCFKIYDQWIIELKDAPTPSLSFSVTFKIDFVKRTMFKGMIQKSIQAETKEWFKGYVSMVQNSLKEHIVLKSKKEIVEKKELKLPKEPSQVERKEATIESIEVSIHDSADSMSKSGTRRRSSVFSAIGKVMPTGGILKEENVTAASPNGNEQLFDKSFVDPVFKISVVLVVMMLMYYVMLIQQRVSDIADQLQQMNANTATLVRLLENQRVEL